MNQFGLFSVLIYVILVSSHCECAQQCVLRDSCVDALLRNYDKNGDGFLNLEEYNKIRIHIGGGTEYCYFKSKIK